MSNNSLEFLGLWDVQLVLIQGHQLRDEVILPLRQLQLDAAGAGFELAVASGYRSFARQQRIWDEKARGARPLLDDQGEPLCIDRLTNEQLMFAILRWSALPGASRHHWGTDFDVFDRAGVSKDQKVRLTFDETVGAGPFAPFHRWLDQRLLEPGCPFFRPYVRPSGGVAPEPWHLSFAPLASKIQSQLDLNAIERAIQNSDIALKEEVLARLPEIFDRFIWIPWSLYPEQFQIA